MKPAATLGAYDHTKIEPKWQKYWHSKKLYQATEDPKMKKFFGLIEFPYPSGDGLHVGHIRSNTAMDIISRKRRAEGYNVLYPIGWDAFGLPAENYAIKTGTQPAVVVKKNIDTFRRQLKALGFSFDWSREVNTTDPAYYKWTQWIFLQFFKKGLAYKKKMTINWCPKDLIGLANEEVINGACERCGTAVEKREKEQWMLAITKYADRLLSGLDARVTPKGDLLEGSIDQPCFTQTTEPGAVRPELPFVERKAIVAIVKHWSEDKYIGLKWKKVDWQTLITGGLEGDQTPVEGAAMEIIEETGYKNPTFVRHLGKVDAKFFHVPKNVNRYAHFDALYFELKDGDRNEITAEEQGNHDVVWLSKEEMTAFVSPDSQRYVWAKFLDPTITSESFGAPVLNWREAIKEQQRNWIGKSEGAELVFKLKARDFQGKEINVFTTRPDTIFGVTYVVLAPEHVLIKEFLSVVGNKSEVESYIAQVKKESDMERTDATKEKTGVELKGVKAINPANNEEVPVWIADYVLADYGTGAVMAVPAHDERDGVFAKKYGLPIREVVAPLINVTQGDFASRPGVKTVARECILAIVKHWEKDEFLCLKAPKHGWTTFVIGGIDPGEDPVEAAKREIIEETGFTDFTLVKKLGGHVYAKHFAPHKNENRSAMLDGYYFELKSGARQPVAEHESNHQQISWVARKDIPTALHPKITDWAFWQRFVSPDAPFVGDGVLENSGSFNGKESSLIKKEIAESVGGKWITTFKLRDWIFSRQRYWGEPIPVVNCKACGLVPVPEKDLPVKLPPVKNYKPTETGESPLAAITKWVNTKCLQCKGPATRETDTMPNWAGSSWYYLRYADPKNKKAFADREKLNYWTPVDWYNGGMEHTTLHLLYSRFWHKFLFDLGLVPTDEPYTKRTSHGLILAEGGVKMSKSKGNVINPDGIVATVGADSLRLYEMFMGPFDQPIAWDTNNIAGVRRFIERVWKLREKVVAQTDEKTDDVVSVNNTIHKAIKKVSDDIELMRFNTAISALMITLNKLETFEAISAGHYEVFLQLLAPFAPHVTEELWASLGNKKSISFAPWPVYDPALAVDSEATIIIQINGKMRGTFRAPVDALQEDLEYRAKNAPEAAKWLEGKEVKKVIVVPNKLVNIVVG